MATYPPALLIRVAAHAAPFYTDGSLSIRERLDRDREWELATATVFERPPYRAQLAASTEYEALPDSGGTRFTDVEARGAYKSDRVGAGVRWAHIEEHDLFLVEGFAELRHGPFGAGIQQTRRRDRPVATMLRLSFDDSWTLGPFGASTRASLAANDDTRAYSLYTELAGPSWHGLSPVAFVRWELPGPRQAKLSIRYTWGT